MATWFLPEDAVYVIAYEYWSQPKAQKGSWKKGQVKAFPSSKIAVAHWNGFVAMAGKGAKFRNMQIIPVNVYKE
jgi:hypothetical protein